MNKVLRIGTLLLLIAGIALAIIYRDQFDATELENRVNDAGKAGPVVFMLIYAIGTVFFLPGSVLTLAGGALFGPAWGTFYNLTGATAGAVISFLAARYLASEWVEHKTAGRLKQLKQGVEGEGWRFIAFVRLVPLFPFNLLNYALGLTRISTRDYAVASYIFMLPGAIAYTYIGYVGREAMINGDGLIQKTMFALALLAIVGFLPGLIARVRRGPMIDVDTLKQKLDANEDILILDVRSHEDFIGEQGYIADAVNIPVEQLPDKIMQLADRTEKPIAIICRTDKRSAKAAQILTRHGFADIHIVRNGMTAWNDTGYTIEQ